MDSIMDAIWRSLLSRITSAFSGHNLHDRRTPKCNVIVQKCTLGLCRWKCVRDEIAKKKKKKSFLRTHRIRSDINKLKKYVWRKSITIPTTYRLSDVTYCLPPTVQMVVLQWTWWWRRYSRSYDDDTILFFKLYKTIACVYVCVYLCS